MFGSPTPDGMDMMATCGDMAPSLDGPPLAPTFACVLVCLRDLLGQLSARRDSLGHAPSAGAAATGDAAAAAACRVAMGVTMAFMLLIMN
jgi:hypothetical protein